MAAYAKRCNRCSATPLTQYISVNYLSIISIGPARVGAGRGRTCRSGGRTGTASSATTKAVDEAGARPKMNATLELAFRAAQGPKGLDVRRFLSAVSRYYDEVEQERRGVVRTMRMMSDEAQALTREVREESASQLEAILDHVKDVIITVDAGGEITSFNLTGERLFGYPPDEIEGRQLTELLPEFVPSGLTLASRLERLATRAEDTHVDLAAHDAVGLTKRGARFPAEIAVSKLASGRRPGYVVCVRDATERHHAEAATREAEARYRLLVEHAPEAIVVLDVEASRFVDCNRNAEKFFRLTRDELLKIGDDGVNPPAQPSDGATRWAERGYLTRALAGAPTVFEWIHRDAHGKDVPCEVRMARLPSAGRDSCAPLSPISPNGVRRSSSRQASGACSNVWLASPNSPRRSRPLPIRSIWCAPAPAA